MKWDRLMGIAVLVFVFVVPGHARGECLATPLPLRHYASQSKVILFGEVVKVRETLNGDGITVFRISRIIKQPDRFLTGEPIIELPGLIRVDPKGPGHYLVFSDIFQGELDVFRMEPVSVAALEYLSGLLAIGAEDNPGVLRFCFDYLQHADETIARDTHLEFGGATPETIAEAASGFSPWKLRRWLLDPKVPTYRLELYASLLGHCGVRGDYILLHYLAQRQARQDCQGLHGILKGYVLLEPPTGWATLRSLLKDSSRDWKVRYHALRTVTFFHENLPGIIPQKERIAALVLLLDQPDMADLAIECLRKWSHWDLTDRILALYTNSAQTTAITRRSILRYALQCPQVKAAAFVAEVRKRDAELVADQVELLTLEAATPPIPTTQ